MRASARGSASAREATSATDESRLKPRLGPAAEAATAASLLARFEQFRHVHAERVAFCFPARGLDDLARAEPEAQAPRDRQGLEPALEPHGVVVRRDEGVELLLLLSGGAALLDVDAHGFHP